MKNALLNWKNILIGTAIVVVIACVAIIPYFVISDSAVWPISYISYVFLFSGVVAFFIGFVIQDIYRARLRHKTKNWNNPLPKDKISKAKDRAYGKDKIKFLKHGIFLLHSF